jgi:prevent-host-death family protein
MSEIQSESIREARAHFADLVDRADRDDEPTIITRRGKEVAAIVSMDMLRWLKQAEENWVVRIVDERLASTEPGVPLADVLAETAARTD